jgi:hypothetical protein
LRAVRRLQHRLVKMMFGNAWGRHSYLPFATPKTTRETTLQTTAVEGRDGREYRIASLVCVKLPMDARKVLPHNQIK